MALARLIESQAPAPRQKTRAQKKAEAPAPPQQAIPAVAECLPELAAAIGLTSLHVSVSDPLAAEQPVREPALELAVAKAKMPSFGLQTAAEGVRSPGRSEPLVRPVQPALPDSRPTPPAARLTVALAGPVLATEPPKDVAEMLAAYDAPAPPAEPAAPEAAAEKKEWEPAELAGALEMAASAAIEPAQVVRSRRKALPARKLLVQMPPLALLPAGGAPAPAELVRLAGQLVAAPPCARALPASGWRTVATQVALPILPASRTRATLSEANLMVIAGVAGACATEVQRPLAARAAAGASTAPALPAPGLQPEWAQPREDAPVVVEERAPAALCEKLWPLHPPRPVSPGPQAAPSSSLPGARWEQVLACAAEKPHVAHRPDNPDRADGERPESAASRAAVAVRRLFLPVQQRFGRHWQHAPADLKWIALGVPLVLLLVLYSNISPQLSQRRRTDDGGVKRAVGSTYSSLRQTIAARAAINLSDDFRSGLGAWTGDGNWAQSWSYNQANFALPGQLALYRPTLPLHDYSLDFLAQIETRGLHWVVRAADTRNYYALSVVLTRNTQIAGATFMRRAVLDGVAEAPVSLPLPASVRADAIYRVRTEVRGNSFVTYLQGQIVDSFNDNRLEKGGVGFYSPKGERSMIRWVEVTHQYDFLGRLCAWLAPYGPQGEERTVE